MSKPKQNRTVRSCRRCKYWQGGHWNDDDEEEIWCRLAIDINTDGNWDCNPHADWCTYGANKKPKIEPRTDDNTLMRLL